MLSRGWDKSDHICAAALPHDILIALSSLNFTCVCRRHGRLSVSRAPVGVTCVCGCPVSGAAAIPHDTHASASSDLDVKILHHKHPLFIFLLARGIGSLDLPVRHDTHASLIHVRKRLI